jgi:ABC-type nitrate/sulfonate/bicarbonate transport system permease component
MTLGPGHRLALGAVGLLAAAGAWLWLSWNSTDAFFPPLREMIPQALAFWSSPDGLADMGSTLANLGRGLLLGIASGIAIGLVVGQVRTLDLALTPLFEFLRSIPNVALLPFAIALFGIGDGMKIFGIAFGTAWPVLLNTTDGVRQVPHQWKDTAVVYGLSKFQRQVEVIIPAVVPRILAGIHVAIPLSLILAVTSEMIGTTAGIGSVILNAQYTYEVDLMWSGILLLGVVGWILTVLFAAVERLLRRWSGSEAEAG